MGAGSLGDPEEAKTRLRDALSWRMNWPMGVIARSFNSRFECTAGGKKSLSNILLIRVLVILMVH